MLPDQEEFFNQLYRDNYWVLERYARVHLSNSSQAEEVVQDTFHEAVQRLELLLSYENPAGWLMRTLQNKIKNCERANKRYALHIMSLDAEVVALIAAAESVEDTIIQQESDSETVRKIKEVLSPQELYILKRLIFDKVSHKELAIELGISVWTSQKRLERIREKLDKLFPGYWRKK